MTVSFFTLWQSLASQAGRVLLGAGHHTRIRACPEQSRRTSQVSGSERAAKHARGLSKKRNPISKDGWPQRHAPVETFRSLTEIIIHQKALAFNTHPT
ncbi:MAG: hypothetical protein HYR70_04400 [Chloroflexi bacterium]|nr:hypothetical protein [Chloroflexota bacterium]MBI3340797.1 hypothetical protein [Chloroflexota bacterium]